MPVAGPLGLGTAAAVKDRGNAAIIGVDTDWYYSAPDYKEITLTSVMKNTDKTTFLAIKSVVEGTFAGGVITGTLENGGVGLAPFHDFAGDLPPGLQDELETVKAGILDGTIETLPPGDQLYLPIVEKISYHPDFKACLATDTTGVDDQSWNAGAWKGIQNAAALWHIEGIDMEPGQESDYPKHIDAFIDDNCDLITTVGYTMGDATSTAATAHPAQKFSIVDVAYDPIHPNILSQVYASDEAAFLAGYAAAGLTQNRQGWHLRRHAAPDCDGIHGRFCAGCEVLYPTTQHIY